MDALVDRRVSGSGRVGSRTGSLRLAVLIMALSAATIAAVFAFQFAGYPPCELCSKERLPFYAGIALAAATSAVAWRGPRWAAQACFAALALLYIGSAAFGIYHAGVEWDLWPGPADCTGPLSRATSNADFLHQLQSFKAVRCDAVAIRVLGLSLAGWNAVVSLGFAGLAIAGFLRSRH